MHSGIPTTLKAIRLKFEVFDTTGAVKETIYSKSVFKQPLLIPIADHVSVTDWLSIHDTRNVVQNRNLIVIALDDTFSGGKMEFALYDTKNLKLINRTYSDIGSQYQGLIKVADSNGKYSFIDENGNQIIECKYADANIFQKGWPRFPMTVLIATT